MLKRTGFSIIIVTIIALMFIFFYPRPPEDTQLADWRAYLEGDWDWVLDNELGEPTALILRYSADGRWEFYLVGAGTIPTVTGLWRILSYTEGSVRVHMKRAVEQEVQGAWDIEKLSDDQFILNTIDSDMDEVVFTRRVAAQ